MDLTCLTINPPIPSIPKTANDSNTFSHQTYNPSSGGIAQMISASLARSTFSTNDIHSLINNFLNGNNDPWSVSKVVKTGPVPSIIIYSSIALALFLIFSIIFCVMSCTGSKKGRHRGSKITQVCVCLLIIVYLLGIGDVIYVAYRINKSKVSIDSSIKGVNRDIYPKEIAEHMEYLTKEFDYVDKYTVDTNSILINASRSMLVKAFDRILTEKYFIQDIDQSVNNMSIHFQELGDEVRAQSSLPSLAIDLFKELEGRYLSLVIYVQVPIQEVCDYANGTHTDIDQKLLEALDIVHVELKKLNETIKEDILTKITPWEKHTLLNTKLEEQILKYSSLAGTIILVVVIVLGTIPLVFFIFIFISRVCGCCQDESEDDLVPMTDVRTDVRTISIDDDSSHNPRRQYTIRHRVPPAHHHRKGSRSQKGNSSGGVFCLMRIAFAVMIVLLVLMVLVSGVYYTLDLAVQGSCRTVHNDQPYLVNLVTSELIKSNVIFGNRTEMNTTIMNLINDCGNQIHFSRKLLGSYWSTLDDNVKDMMNTLSGHIYDQFIQSMRDIDIPSDMDLLARFVSVANVSNISTISAAIETDFITLDGYFVKINSSNSTLPQELVQDTVDQFEAYVRDVLESTVDKCPLPLSTVSKTDTLVCHTLGGSISGLWFDVFVCMLLITLGFCIFGISVYKRLNRSTDAISSGSRF